ncbi:hypothetical protein Pmani_031547 [Petrolisthes manimaculis]|uniref:Uncharacterized protein n=1 Tax=Petrolisthes manimaculis TaxID=1843537 RepID=A0AAE1NVG0_9EUCA|nr:hypothetical protein Pmani_031547 [Petrolisthes manimaculis]
MRATGHCFKSVGFSSSLQGKKALTGYLGSGNAVVASNEGTSFWLHRGGTLWAWWTAGMGGMCAGLSLAWAGEREGERVEWAGEREGERVEWAGEREGERVEWAVSRGNEDEEERDVEWERLMRVRMSGRIGMEGWMMMRRGEGKGGRKRDGECGDEEGSVLKRGRGRERGGEERASESDEEEGSVLDQVRKRRKRRRKKRNCELDLTRIKTRTGHYNDCHAT